MGAAGAYTHRDPHRKRQETRDDDAYENTVSRPSGRLLRLRPLSDMSPPLMGHSTRTKMCVEPVGRLPADEETR